MIWVIADTHFGHKEIKKICNRPDDYELQIITNWNDLVAEEDTIICLGDIAWSIIDLRIFKELKGKKILTLGNHDIFSKKIYQKYFDIVCKEYVLKHQGINFIFSHEPKIFHYYDINVHGHLHNLAKIESICKHFNVALEEMGYRPISLNEITREACWKREFKK